MYCCDKLTHKQINPGNEEMNDKDSAIGQATGYSAALPTTPEDHDNELQTVDQLPFQSQLDLFQVQGDQGDSWMLSNITGIYDLLPKTTISLKERKKPIVKRQLPITMPDSRAKLSMDIEIKPALQEDGKFKYPGIIEDKVEDALKYLASQKGATNIENINLSVEFTLYEVQQVLAQVLVTKYSINQVRDALQTLAESHLSVRPSNGDDTLTFKSSRISSLTMFEKGTYKQVSKADKALGTAGKGTLCRATFHPMFAMDVAKGFFRYYNVQRKASFKNPVTDLLYDRICFHWRYASVESSYRFSAEGFLNSTPYGDSDLNSSRRFGKVRKAVEELMEHGILSRFEDDIRYELKVGIPTRKISDIVFSLYASEEFQREVFKLNGIFRKRKKAMEKSLTSDSNLIE